MFEADDLALTGRIGLECNDSFWTCVVSVGISNVYNIVSSNSARDKVVEKVQFNLPPKIEHTDQSTNENMMSRVLNGSKQTNDKLLKNVSLI